MIIVITRSGNCIGISTAVGSIDTRILTLAASAGLGEDLKELASEGGHVGSGLVRYDIQIRDEDGTSRNLTVADDPGNQWSTPLKRILNKAGMAGRI